MSEFVEGVEQTFEVEQGVTSTLPPGYRAAVPHGEHVRKLAEQRDTQEQMARDRQTAELVAQTKAMQYGAGGYREPAEAWAHCGDQRGGCEDTQERVKAVRVSYAQTYALDGGSLSGRLENSWTEYEFADQEDATCKRCGNRRQITGQQRPVYESLSGFNQKALLTIARTQLLANGQPAEGTVVQSAKPPTATSPLDALGYRLAMGQIEIEEFVKLRAALVEVVDSTPSVEKANGVETLPKGVRHRGDKFQARLNKSETPDGEPERILGTFDTIDEAVSAREAALS